MVIQDDFLRQFNKKDEQAYYRLFQLFYAYLVLFADRRVENRKVAEDIVQEIFITIWESDKQYNSVNGLKAYLYELTANRCTDYWKHRAVENKYTEYARYEQKLPDFSVQQEETYRELYTVIGELPERSREVILLHLEGNKNSEIAQLMDITILTVKTHKKKAFSYLRSHLKSVMLLIIRFQKNQGSVEI